MYSLWQQTAPIIEDDPFPKGERADIAVIGAGITGLTTALLFARAGRRTIVIEAREVGAVATGHTTAKVSRLQGTMSDRVRGRNTAGVARAYAQSQLAAFGWLERFCADSGVELERRDAYSFATTPEGRARVEAEFRAATAVGMPVELVDRVDLPFATTGAVRLADQGQLDPMLLLAALAREFRALGGRLVTGARVTAVRATDPVLVQTTAGVVEAGIVVLATGAPILDRALYFAKLAAHRSYAQAWRVPDEQLPDGMFIDVERPTRSIRTAGRPDTERLLLTGGYGHGVGRHPSPRRAADELAAWTREQWPDAEPVAEWSAQDYLTPHGVPFVGWLPRGRGRVYLATGFSKWGMTNGVATALTLVADVLGDGTGWQRVLHRRPTLPAAIAVGIGENAAVASWYARSWLGALARPLGSAPVEGHGEVGRDGIVPTAVSTVEGTTTSLCAVCPHLGAVVGWNDFEQSWDCPAHGSRFAPDGSVLEGPAKRGLAPRQKVSP